jgi:hypothetical protein
MSAADQHKVLDSRRTGDDASSEQLGRTGGCDDRGSYTGLQTPIALLDRNDIPVAGLADPSTVAAPSSQRLMLTPQAGPFRPVPALGAR